MSKEKKQKKDVEYYLNLPWTFLIETAVHKNQSYYIIRVNELPGICTDAKSLDEGMEEIKQLIACAIDIYKEKGEEMPEPIKLEDFKGKILYRTDSERHYNIAKYANMYHKSISKSIDDLIDKGFERVRKSL